MQVVAVQSITETARILRKYTEPEKLNSFESIELELRNQKLQIKSFN